MEDKYFYRKLIDEIPLPVYVFQEGDLVFFNQAFVDYSGYSRSELTTMDFLDLIHPDYRNTLVAQTKSDLSGKVDNLPQENDIQVLRKGGETRWVRIKPHLIEHNDQPAVLGVVADVTEFKTLSV
jgi:two-component system cell cycle sensor histidine kinase/response regulator CckA